jgi:hypothetical protein
LWLDEAVGFKQMVVWDKGPMGMGWHYRRSYETVLVGEKRGGKCRWYDDSQTIENIIRPGAYGITKILPGRGHQTICSKSYAKPIGGFDSPFAFAHGIGPDVKSWGFSFQNPLSEVLPKASVISRA